MHGKPVALGPGLDFLDVQEPGPHAVRQVIERIGGVVRPIHHLAFDVLDLDAAVKTFKSLGVDVVMSGVRKGLRFAYLDAEQGGLVLELIERHE